MDSEIIIFDKNIKMTKFVSTSDKKIMIALHAIAWIIVIIIPLYPNSAFCGGNNHRI